MSSLATKIYSKLPYWVQNILISAYGFMWRSRRLGGVFKEEVKKFKAREAFTYNEWQEYQLTELKKVLIHAFNTAAFYKKNFQNAGITQEQLENFQLEDLKKLPFLTKAELREYSKTDLVSSVKEKGSSFFASSGSTGTPVNILISHLMHQRYTAMAEARCRNWAGVTYKDPRGMIGGRRILPEGDAKGPFHRYNIFEKQAYFSAYHISPKTAEQYLAAIKKHKLTYMNGYAMSNYILASFFKDLQLEVPQLKAVITSSEKLTPEMRQTFEEVYKCKVYDSYSGVECCAAITECEKGSLHLNPDVGVVELINSKGEYAKAGEEAELVATGLLNFSQPLIRYKTGDMVVMSDKKCECGREMPVISEIVGRIEDVVVGKDGREMVRFHGIFIDLPNVVKAQVIQEDFDDFNIIVQKNQPLTQQEKDTIKARMESQLGDIKLKIEEVDEIPVGANGKFKAVISKVKKGE